MDSTLSSIRSRPSAAAGRHQPADGTAAAASPSRPAGAPLHADDGGLRPRRAAPNAAGTAAPQGEAPPPRGGDRLAAAIGIGTNLLLGAWATSTAYRAVRNPGDFAHAPLQTLTSALTFSERLGPQDLNDARQAVLERFGAYIRPDSQCHDVQPQIHFQIGNVPGAYASNPYGKGPVLYVAPFHRPGSGHHAIEHELVHCYTHPKLYDTLTATESGTQLLEAMTEHLADKLPGSRLGKLSGYDVTRMSNGRNMVGAAAQLEQVVGEQVLLNAMFGGDAKAVSEVSRAAVELFPKKATTGAWNAIGAACRKQGAHEMAEAFLAASLLHEKKLPADSDWRMSARAHLPLLRFSDVTKAQKKALLAQADAARQRLGAAVLDQAFCNFDERAATVAMRAIRSDLLANWQRVL
jgi:hypothetical protein